MGKEKEKGKNTDAAMSMWHLFEGIQFVKTVSKQQRPHVKVITHLCNTSEHIRECCVLKEKKKTACAVSYNQADDALISSLLYQIMVSH